MPRELFEAVTDLPARRRTASALAWPLTVLLHALLLVVAIVVPLVATDAIPVPHYALVLMAPPEAPALPAAPSTLPPRGAEPTVARNRDLAPLVAPAAIGTEDGLDTAARGLADPVGDVASGIAGGIDGGLPVTLAPPPEPPKPTAPVPVGGHIKAPQKLRDVPPVYPEMAQRARVEGIVILEAVISTTGDVEQLKVLRSVPLLDGAAVAAVRQWKYTPTLLNGVPVPVVFTVTVRFVLR